MGADSDVDRLPPALTVTFPGSLMGSGESEIFWILMTSEDPPQLLQENDFTPNSPPFCKTIITKFRYYVQFSFSLFICLKAYERCVVKIYQSS